MPSASDVLLVAGLAVLVAGFAIVYGLAGGLLCAGVCLVVAGVLNEVGE